MNKNKPPFPFLSLSPSGLVVMLNPGFAQISHVTSAGFVVSNSCADMAIARSSSPGIALNAPRVESEVKAGFHPGRGSFIFFRAAVKMFAEAPP
jgi:hypothetical protein